MTALNRGYYITTALAIVGLLRRDEVAARQRLAPGCVVDVLPLRHDRRAHFDRLRLHHPVLHRVQVPPGPLDRRGVADRPGDQHHHRASRSASSARWRPVIAISVAILTSYKIGVAAAARRRPLRHRGRDHGHARHGRLHPRHGHLRADHGQRRRHRRDVDSSPRRSARRRTVSTPSATRRRP